MNGGHCTATIDRYICTCKPGFLGFSCEKHSNCFPNPCKHGICSPDSEGYVCTCKDGWRGKACDEPDKCRPNQCIHGGTCSETPSGIDCTCLAGFRGKFCELEAKCSPINPCHNNGKCEELTYAYQCICKEGFYGHNCEGTVKTTLPPPSVPPKAAPPQVIPVPLHEQPPFTLEGFNSDRDYAAATTAGIGNDRVISAVNCCEAHEAPHHVPQYPSVIVHTEDDKHKEVKPKGGNIGPPDHRKDDRYVTHLVAVPIKAGPAKNIKENKKPQFSVEKPSKPSPKPVEPATKKPTSKAQEPVTIKLTSKPAVPVTKKKPTSKLPEPVTKKITSKPTEPVTITSKPTAPVATKKLASKFIEHTTNKPTSVPAELVTPKKPIATASNANGKHGVPRLDQEDSAIFINSDMKNFEDEIKSVSNPLFDDVKTNDEGHKQSKSVPLDQHKINHTPHHTTKLNNNVIAALHKIIGTALHKYINRKLNSTSAKEKAKARHPTPKQTKEHFTMQVIGKYSMDKEDQKLVHPTAKRVKVHTPTRLAIRPPKEDIRITPSVILHRNNTQLLPSIKGNSRPDASPAIPLTKKHWCPGFCARICDKWCATHRCCDAKLANGQPKPISQSGITDVCASCSENADCKQNRCVCKFGFIGDGHHCRVDPCALCDNDAHCVDGGCQCNVGYYGNGFDCEPLSVSKRCPHCNDNADCLGGDCFCRPGFYGTGFECWPFNPL